MSLYNFKKIMVVPPAKVKLNNFLLYFLIIQFATCFEFALNRYLTSKRAVYSKQNQKRISAKKITFFINIIS